MASRRISTDQDNTIRGLDGYTLAKRPSNQTEPDEHNSDDSDLFLRAAKEEELARHDSNGDLSRTDSKMVRYPVVCFMYPHYTLLFTASGGMPSSLAMDRLIVPRCVRHPKDSLLTSYF